MIRGINNPVLDARQSARFLIVEATNVTITGITFVNGFSAEDGGALLNRGGFLGLHDVIFIDNHAKYGGAISGEGHLEVAGTAFRGCNATIHGGAVFSNQTVLGISNTSFSRCVSRENGGAIFDVGGNLQITGSDFSACTSLAGGGAVSSSDGYVAVKSSTFLNCKASSQGGSVVVLRAKVNFSDCDFSSSSAATTGGAIFSYSSVLNIDASRFTASSSHIAGAISSSDSDVALSSSYFEACQAGAEGGSAWFSTSKVLISGCEFSSSSSPLVYSGTLLFWNVASMMIEQSIFRDSIGGTIGILDDHSVNSSSIVSKSVFIRCQTIWYGTYTEQGGAIHVNSWGTANLAVIITGCKFSFNYAGSNGGDMYMRKWNGNMSLTVSNSTFYSGMSEDEGGSLNIGGDTGYWSSVVIENSHIQGYTNGVAGGWDYRVVGGACYFDRISSIALVNVAFVDCTSDQGGAVSVGAWYADEQHTFSVRIHKSRFQGCYAYKFAGALDLADGGAVEITSSSFLDSYAGYLGGAVGVYASLTTGSKLSLTVTDSFFDASSTNGEGAALYTRAIGQIFFANVTMQDGESTFGGAIAILEHTGITSYIDKSIVTVANSRFSRNKASQKGGSLYVGIKSTISVLNCTFESSSASEGGSLSVIHSTSSLNMRSSVFNFSTAATSGGAISIPGNFTADGCLFESCAAVSKGGAIELSGIAHISNTTFKGNKVTAPINDLNCLVANLYSFWGMGWQGATMSVVSLTNPASDASYDGLTLSSGYSTTHEASVRLL